MSKPIHDIDNLIARHLAGESTAEDAALLQDWRVASESNEKYFRQLERIFLQTHRAAHVTFNEDEAWRRLKQKMVPDKKVIPLHRNARGFSIYFRIAASIALVALFGFIAWKYLITSRPTQIAAVDQRVVDTLPGGSTVVVNKKSSLEYRYNRIRKEHRVKLRGEAYFEIEKESDQTFIVETEDLFVRDIGTSFNLKAYPGSNTVEVVVDEGEVFFFNMNNEGIHIKAPGKGIYNRTTKQFELAQAETNDTSYKSRAFAFVGEDLQTVVSRLNAVYEKQIEISEAISKCPLTVSFDNEDIDEISQIIAETLGLTITETNTTIRLDGTGCGN